ncbi:MAG: hypothetical protein FD143_3701 [Ignavibacteria bacterium]|nr:MAG: hypothetical protein FD143_3701 [Ignavibacteria bacterium]
MLPTQAGINMYLRRIEQGQMGLKKPAAKVRAMTRGVRLYSEARYSTNHPFFGNESVLGSHFFLSLFLLTLEVNKLFVRIVS